ncbi:hypothetical protein G3I40_38845, partial [Streptomyces sp. SID14478]|uniref:hypothetical protein n=1 Tax=Streptomyces sp. SID14478 TaxID=2706073 RepID=UPI0014105D00
ERRLAAVALVLAVGSVSGAVAWNTARANAYPHYEASVPRSFHGIPLSDDGPTGVAMDAYLADLAPRGAQPFFGLYKDADSEGRLVLVGATGDLHDEDPDELLADMGSFWGGPADTWSPDPGPLGGRMECATYQPPVGRLAVCTWVDRGSLGMVMTGALQEDEQESFAQAARELRKATLRPAPEGAA